ncbi:hypothetical protein SAMN05216199_3250 [Pedococcus cremeus]|uniref:Uncharacterized protein n=1 Tax=Pedococcus cremeus TaxID=587636 RepID=A0A1H9WZ25_9MICO|nr:hypothetical protein [Pedococcus cremeus]SES39156.1 hypothetical protein SAMN05216199_3250 [Pedococcus cremeus]
MAGFLYLVVLPAELVLLWLALGYWRPMWARVASSAFVLVVVGAVMLVLDPWQMGLAFGAAPALVALVALPWHVKDLLSRQHDRAIQGGSR